LEDHLTYVPDDPDADLDQPVRDYTDSYAVPTMVASLFMAAAVSILAASRTAARMAA
jgi:hypothetical protein